jgi:plastocyanin
MRGRPVRVALAALAGASLLAACRSGGPSPPPGAPFEVPGTPVATTRVDLPKSYRFDPPVIEVRVGDTVTWTNRDDFPHNVHLLDGTDRTVPLPVGASGSLSFDRPGTVYYECSVHPQQMRGKVIVTPG